MLENCARTVLTFGLPLVTMVNHDDVAALAPYRGHYHGVTPADDDSWYGKHQ